MSTNNNNSSNNGVQQAAQPKKTFYERNHQQVNFQIASTLFVAHLLMQEKVMDGGICAFVFPNAIIYIGATRSLKSYDIVEKRKLVAGAETAPRSRLRELWQALQVPVFATAALLAIYFCLIHEYKYLNHLINGYFLLMAAYTMHEYQFEFLDNSFGNLSFLGQSRRFLFGYSVNHLLSVGFAGYAIADYVMNSHWMLNNYIAIHVCIYSIEKWLQSQFWQICVIFAGLIAYDVSFVFGSDVMMTVARGFDSPMKILFRISEGYSLLGIGDIIIPGLLISMCLRVDFIRGLFLKALQRKKELERSQSREDVVSELTAGAATLTSQQNQEQPSRYYFYVSLIGYNFGLIGSGIALGVTKKPQPALLYICPIMVLTYVAAAFVKHETLEMICYDEDKEICKFEVKTKKASE